MQPPAPPMPAPPPPAAPVQMAAPPAAAPAPPPAAAPAPPAPATPAYVPNPEDMEKFKALYAACGFGAPAAPAPEAPAAAVPPPDAAPGEPGKEPPEKNAAGMGCPSATNTAPPKFEGAKMAADTAEVVRYQKRVEDLEARVAKSEFNEKLSRYKMDILDLAREVVCDPAEELHFCQNMDQEQFEGYVGRCRKNYAKIPGGDMVRMADLDAPVVGQKAGKFNSRDDIDRVLKYQAEHPGTTFTDARDKVLVG